MASLSDFAVTDRQRQIIGMLDTMSYRQIASKLGISPGTITTVVRSCRMRAAIHGLSPEHDMTKTCPEPYYVKGTSTLYGDDGEKKLQWVKTTADQDRLKLFAEELATSICETVSPVKKIAAPRRAVKDQLAVYPIGDAHIGLYCWSEDAGEDYDCRIAEKIMLSGYNQVLESTPDCEEALIVNLGDWFHTDTSDNRTMRSGNVLDVDTRWARVLRVGVRIMRFMADRALQKHKRVRIINSVGNHDDHTSVMLSLVLQAAYEKNPRLTVDTSPDSFHWHEFGQNLIGVHHGHKCKPEQLYKVMAEDRRDAWGRCRHRYWYTGHVHHGRQQDIGGASIEAFRTLTPRDNYAHGNGYRSPRTICSIVHNREHGQCFRTTVDVEACR